MLTFRLIQGYGPSALHIALDTEYDLQNNLAGEAELKVARILMKMVKGVADHFVLEHVLIRGTTGEIEKDYDKWASPCIPYLSVGQAMPVLHLKSMRSELCPLLTSVFY